MCMCIRLLSSIVLMLLTWTLGLIMPVYEVVEHIEQEDECTYNAWVEAADQLDLEERFEICSTENRAACVYRTP